VTLTCARCISHLYLTSGRFTLFLSASPRGDRSPHDVKLGVLSFKSPPVGECSPSSYRHGCGLLIPSLATRRATSRAPHFQAGLNVCVGVRPASTGCSTPFPPLRRPPGCRLLKSCFRQDWVLDAFFPFSWGSSPPWLISFFPPFSRDPMGGDSSG